MIFQKIAGIFNALLVALVIFATTGIAHALESHDLSHECEVCLLLDRPALEGKGVALAQIIETFEILRIVEIHQVSPYSYHANHKALRAPPVGSFS